MERGARVGGGAIGVPEAWPVAWSSASATEASLSTPLGDAGASAEREKSAPIMTAGIPSPKSSARSFTSICVHKICSS